MALPLANNAEGGTNATAETTANSGGASGDAWDVVTGSLFAFASDQAANGTLSHKVSMGAALTVNYGSWTTKVGTVSAPFYGRFYFRSTVTFASGSPWMLQFLSGATICFEFIWNSGVNTLGVKNTAGTTVGTDATQVFVANTWYRAEFTVSSLSTTTGALTSNIYLGNSTTPSGTGGTVSAANFGATSMNTVRMGIVSGGTINTQQWFDGLQINTTGRPGPETAAATRPKPTVVTQAVNRAVTRCQRLTRRRSGLFVPAEWANKLVVAEVA